MAENTEVEEEKKSSKKMIIIAALVLLLGGGGAGYFFMASDPTETEDEQTEKTEAQADATEGSNEKLYTALKKPLIINFPKGSSARLIQVSLSLLVKSEETIEALEKHQPMLRNNLLMLISAKGPKKLASKEGKEELRAEMLEEIGKIMTKMTGKNKVDNVFFTTFVMQ